MVLQIIRHHVRPIKQRICNGRIQLVKLTTNRGLLEHLTRWPFQVFCRTTWPIHNPQYHAQHLHPSKLENLFRQLTETHLHIHQLPENRTKNLHHLQAITQAF